MIASRSARSLAALGFVAALLVLLAPIALGADSDCAAADALASTRRLTEARAAYAAVLKEHEGEPCAIAGLAAVGAARRAAVEALEDGQTQEALGDKEKARAEYVKALQLDASFAEAVVALEALDKTESSESIWAAAIALRAAGYEADAATAAKDVLKAHPSESLPPDLAGLPGSGSPVARSVNRTTLPGLAGDLVSLAPVIAFVVVVVLLVPFTRRQLLRLFGRDRDVLVVEDFDDSSVETKAGKATAGGVLSELRLLRTEGADFRLDLAVRPDPAIAGLPEAVLGVLPQGKVLAGLSGAITPPKWRVKGSLLPAKGARGPGILVTLEPADKAPISMTFWANDYDGHEGLSKATAPEAGDLLRVVAFAATAWIAYRIREPGRPAYPLPTRDWTSYAQFRAASFWQVNEGDARAMVMYLRALATDRGNWLALMNAGTLHKDESRGRVLVQRAIDLLDESAGEAGRSPELNTAYFQARYRHAVLGYVETLPHAELSQRDGEVTTAMQVALEVLARRAWPCPPELRRFLDEFVDVALVFLAGVRRLRKVPDGSLAPTDPRDRKTLREKLGTLGAGELIQFLGPEPEASLDRPRILYNLACYRAETKDKSDRTLAFTALGGAFVRADLRIRAKEDKTLESLHGDPRWAELFGAYGESEHSGGILARLGDRLIELGTAAGGSA